jgi:peptidoglycan/xylan/chitin deacetylase (PgdA/CDA1 family)
VLMYHAVGPAGEAPSRFVVPLRRFRRQMRLLALLRYRVLSLQDLLHRLRLGDVPGRTLALTLDDGYADNRLAFAELERRGFPVTLFAVSGLDRNEWDADPPLGGRPLFTLDELRELGPLVEIGAHTRTHPALTGLDHAAARGEIAGSRRDLEAALGRAPQVFAYPYGLVDAQVRSIVEESGFLGACGVGAGRNGADSDLFDLRRLEVQGTFSLWRFALALALEGTGIRGRRRRR